MNNPVYILVWEVCTFYYHVISRKINCSKPIFIDILCRLHFCLIGLKNHSLPILTLKLPTIICVSYAGII